MLARALSNISTLNEFSLPFLKLSGYALYIKGKNISKEIVDSEFFSKCYLEEAFRIIQQLQICLQLLFNKVKNTPKIISKKSRNSKKKPIRVIIK